MEFWMQTMEVGLMQNSAFLKYIFSFYDKNSLSNV